MVEKILHYSLTNPATVYDEEAMTALELAGRTAAKVNECVERVNEIPQNVTDEVQRHIDSGKFDAQVNELTEEIRQDVADFERDAEEFKQQIATDVNAAEARLNIKYDNLDTTLNGRLDSLILGGSESSPEVTDIRTGADGATYDTAGTAVRTGLKKVGALSQSFAYLASQGYCTVSLVDKTKTQVYFSNRLCVGNEVHSGGYQWVDIITNIASYIVVNDDDSAVLTFPSDRLSLVFNIIEEQLYIRAVDKLQYGDFLLLAVASGQQCAGALLEYVTQYRLKNLEKDTSSLMTDQAAGYIYVSNNAGVDYYTRNENDNAQCYITVYDRLVLNFHGVAESFNWDVIGEHIADRLTISADGKQATIHITGARKSLVLNVPERRLYIRDSKALVKGDVLLAGMGYRHISGGLLQQINQEKRIEKVEASLNAGGNIAPVTQAMMNHNSRYQTTANMESLLFFTDPHLAQHSEPWENLFNQHMRVIHDTWKQTACDNVVCGGDWLGSSDTYFAACHKLGYIHGRTRDMFGDAYHHVVGNHDTNYQGKNADGAENYTGTLPQQAINNLWFKGKPAYYSYDGRCTRFMVLDTGVDNDDTMTAYRMEQLNWLAAQLKDNTLPNAAIIMHMYVRTSGGQIATFAQHVHSLINAYNNRSFVSVAGVNYDFRSVASGKVRFILSGHRHIDDVITNNGVPVVLTTYVREGETTFDLVFADYDKGVLYLDRVGSGESRTVNI